MRDLRAITLFVLLLTILIELAAILALTILQFGVTVEFQRSVPQVVEEIISELQDVGNAISPPGIGR